MMKIAVASENGMVTEHFGHCEGFMIFDTENNQIVKSETIANPGHRPGFLPNFLNDMGVNVIISGGMGGGAIDIYNKKYRSYCWGQRQCRSSRRSVPARLVKIYWFCLS